VIPGNLERFPDRLLALDAQAAVVEAKAEALRAIGLPTPPAESWAQRTGA
jgi:hypothetical protein